MEVRQSTLKDLDDILKIYAHARQEMIKNGNPNQWKDYHPRKEEVIKEIKEKKHFVVIYDKRICGCFSLIFGEDPTYKYIEKGEWLNDEPYATIHKIASDNSVKGIFKCAIDFGFSKINNIRIDTHLDNKIMFHLLNEYGFTYCGTIYLLNQEPREAFQKYILPVK